MIMTFQLGEQKRFDNLPKVAECIHLTLWASTLALLTNTLASAVRPAAAKQMWSSTFRTFRTVRTSSNFAVDFFSVPAAENENTHVAAFLSSLPHLLFKIVAIVHSPGHMKLFFFYISSQHHWKVIKR
jgi:hypothetical protein